MMKPVAWTARNFSFDRPVGTFSEVLKRLRGTPTRPAELVHGYSDETLGRRPKAKSSAKEHLCQLTDLATRDEQRRKEFVSGTAVLQPQT